MREHSFDPRLRTSRHLQYVQLQVERVLQEYLFELFVDATPVHGVLRSRENYPVRLFDGDEDDQIELPDRGLNASQPLFEIECVGINMREE